MRLVIHMKKYGFLIYITVVLILGIITVPLFHSGYLSTLVGGFFSIPFYYHVIWFLFAYFISVLLHELTHLIAFRVKGIKVKALLVLFFVVFLDDHKWRIKLNFKLLKLGGGMVIPQITSIKEDKTYYKIADGISTSLIAAPIFTLVFGTVITLLNLLFFYDMPHFTIFSFFILIFTILFTLASNVSTDLMYGDFKAFDKFKKDPLFKLSIITQYVDELSIYHLELLNAHIVKYPVSDFPNELLPILSTLFEYHIFEHIPNEPLLERARYVRMHAHLLRRFMRKEVYIPLAQYIIYFLDKNNLREDAISLFENFKRNLDQLKLPALNKIYLLKQTSHVLGLSDEIVYLSRHEHVVPSRFSFIFESFPDFYNDEKTHNLGYQRFEKSIDDGLEK